MDPILISERCRLKIIVPERSSRTPVGGEAGYHDDGAVEPQGSTGFRVNSINTVQKRGVQHHRGEDNVRSVGGAVEYVRKFVGYAQSVFDAEIVQSTNV